MPSSPTIVEFSFLVITTLGTAAAGFAFLVTAYIFFRSRQDIDQIKKLEGSVSQIQAKVEQGTYISDEIANVLYDLYELIGLIKAYVELREAGYVVNNGLFDDMNHRISLAEKHFAELGLFSQDSERRKTVQLALAHRYGDADTAKLMQKIADGKIGIPDQQIQASLRALERRLRDNIVYLESGSWTGRPSGGSF
jgi:hypothetical protein